jgi:hypothetical protein
MTIKKCSGVSYSDGTPTVILYDISYSYEVRRNINVVCACVNMLELLYDMINK